MRRLSSGSVILGLLALIVISLPAQAERQAVDWYSWYRDLHGYFGSVGGVLCAPGTPLQFHPDGKITAISRDATCLASIESLNYPLPLNASITQLSLPIRRYSGWPLSHRALRQLVSNQINQVQADGPH